MLRLETTSMRAVTILLLLASSAPTLTFSQQGGRQRRAAAGTGAGAVAGAYSSAGSDSYASSYGGNGNEGGGGGGGGFVFPGPTAFGSAGFPTVLRNYLDQMEAMFAQQQEQAHNAAAAAGAGAGGGGGGVGGGGNSGAAHATLNLNDRGGFASAQLFPDAGLGSRIAAELPPPAGGPIGVFSSSSSSSHVDETGKTHTFKQATVGVNDNGKVKVFSVKDP